MQKSLVSRRNYKNNLNIDYYVDGEITRKKNENENEPEPEILINLLLLANIY